MTKDQVRQQFGANAAAYVSSPTHAQGASLARLVELTAPQPAWRALDVATAAGHTALALAPHVAAVVGLDLTPQMLPHAARLAAERGAANVVWAAGDVDDLPFGDSAFDLVTCRIAAHHFADAGHFLAEAARVLRPGGRLVFLTNSLLSALCVPEDEGAAEERLVRGQRDVRRVAWPGGGVEHHPSHGDWVRVLTSYGLAVEALHEIYAPAGSGDHAYYDIATADWASRWPAEELWVARRAR